MFVDDEQLGFRNRPLKSATEDLTRRRPVWEALSDLFLDTELVEHDYKFIARRVIESNYSPEELYVILWDEVFPVIEGNLRHPAGEWQGFAVDWLQNAILNSVERQTPDRQPATAGIIREAWTEVCRYLPEEYRWNTSEA